MMTFDYISARGDRLPLSNNEHFWLTNIDGQTEMNASLSSSTIGGMDGDTVNNVQAQPRDIIIDLTIKSTANVEDSKRYILNVIKAKQRASLVWTQNERTLTISGIVQSITMPRWTDGVTMQFSLHCEQPYWEDIDFVIQEISEAISLHYFTESPYDMLYFPEAGIPFGEYDTIRTKDFFNSGDVSTGIEISIVAFGVVRNPIIYDIDGNFFGCGYGNGEKMLEMEQGDNIVITTHKGNKTVTLNGVNIYNKIKPNSTWLQLKSGANQFSINSDDDSTDNMSFALIYKQKYV